MRTRVSAFWIILVLGTMLHFAGRAAGQIVPGEGLDTGLGGGNSITGVVYDPFGQKLSRRIQVRLSTMTRGDRISMTDDNGTFQFRGLVAGTYLLTIDKEKDFEPYSQSISIIQMRGGPVQTLHYNVRLRSRVSGDAKPSVVDASFAALPESGRALYTSAQELANKGDHLGAVRNLTLLTRDFPRFMNGFNDLGVSYLKLNEIGKAEMAFRAALEIEPNAPAPLVNYGITLVTLKRYAEAETILMKAGNLKGPIATVHYFLGQALANQGKFTEAEKELNSALKLGGDQMNEGRRVLAVIYASRGERKKAANELERYLKVNPKAADAQQLSERIDQLKQQK